MKIYLHFSADIPGALLFLLTIPYSVVYRLIGVMYILNIQLQLELEMNKMRIIYEQNVYFKERKININFDIKFINLKKGRRVINK